MKYFENVPEQWFISKLFRPKTAMKDPVHPEPRLSKEPGIEKICEVVNDIVVKYCFITGVFWISRDCDINVIYLYKTE